MLEMPTHLEVSEYERTMLKIGDSLSGRLFTAISCDIATCGVISNQRYSAQCKICTAFRGIDNRNTSSAYRKDWAV
jgi:hypothetical protein